MTFLSRLFLLLALLCTLLAWRSAPVPNTVDLETLGMRALQQQDPHALEQLRHWAEAGWPVAQRELALVLDAHAHPDAAAYWWTRASAGHDRIAQSHLADLDYQGSATHPRNLAQAWQDYRALADHDGHASFMLARMSRYGEGTARDPAAATIWLQQAAHQGEAEAMFLLANAYEAGDGVPADPVQARHWLEAAAQADYPPALHALALQLEGAATPEERTRAQQLLREASDERLLHWRH